MELSEEQRGHIAKKQHYISQKKLLVRQRKALLKELAQAESTMEEGLIEEQRAHLAKEIKSLAQIIRDIEVWEATA